jgi:acyl dehydratase
LNVLVLNHAAVGDLIAEYDTGPIDREMLARYAEASGDSNPLHLDAAFARKAGFPDVIVHGMLGMALVGRLLTDNFPAESLRAFNARFAGIVAVDQSLTCRARLESRTETLAVLALEATDESGAVVISGSAQVALAG